jgi:hypothetical protein
VTDGNDKLLTEDARIVNKSRTLYATSPMISCLHCIVAFYDLILGIVSEDITFEGNKWANTALDAAASPLAVSQPKIRNARVLFPDSLSYPNKYNSKM